MTTTAATAAPRKSRKVLAPLATLAVAGALVVGSGASFTSQTTNSSSVVTAGTLQQENSRSNAAIFNVANIKPGDTVVGSVTIKNSGSLPASFKVTEFEDVNGFSQPALLTMSIKDQATGASVFSGTFGDLTTQSLGSWTAGETRTFVYEVKLDQAADDSNQGDTAKASYVWDAVQLTATTIDQTGGTTPLAETKANAGL